MAGRSPKRPARASRGLRTRAVTGIVAVAAFTGLAEGTLTVIVPAYGSGHGGGALGGVLLSVLSVGSLVGAIATGTLRPSADWRGRLVVTTAALTGAFVLLAAVPAGPVGLGLLLVVVGAALAPTLTAGFVALQREVPPRALTEAFTWASFAAAAGSSGGQALAGQLVTRAGVGAALWEPAAAAAVALGLAAVLWVASPARRPPSPS